MEKVVKDNFGDRLRTGNFIGSNLMRSRWWWWWFGDNRVIFFEFVNDMKMGDIFNWSTILDINVLQMYFNP